MRLTFEDKFLLGGATVVLALMLALHAASADDGVHSRDNVCPAGGGACKIVVITESELKSLTGPGMVFDSATWANRANLQPVVDAWKQKIADSPNGIVMPAPEKKDAPKK